jgi:hypothetical protein
MEERKLHPLGSVCRGAGVGRRTFDRAYAAGAIDKELVALTDGGYRKVLDPDAVIAQLKAFLREEDEREANEPPEEGEYDLMSEKAKLEHFKAAREELRYRQESRQLVLADWHQERFVTLVVLVRDRMTQLADRLPAELHSAETIHDLAQVLEQRIREALQEVQEQADELIGDYEDGAVDPVT